MYKRQQYGLWKRDPTNDLRVVRFCLSVPEKEYIKDGMDRALIRRATQQILPDKVRMNMLIRGVQGADWLHRMNRHWDEIVTELEQVSRDERMMQFVNHDSFLKALQKAKAGLVTQHDTDASYKTLMRSLIIYRFLKKHF